MLIALAGVCVLGCGQPASPDGGPALFTLLPAARTGVTFQNNVLEQEGFNVLEYEYFYNGAGVAVGDVNGDGLPDLYFTANMGPDQLYLNKGDLTFENITAQAGIQDEVSWTTGVTMADVNDDGWLDIYVCKSGRVGADRRRNALYINNGDPGSGPGQVPTFTERAAEYGLDDTAYSNHAAFFDYDRDGDLDVFLLNHSIRRYSHFVVEYMRTSRDSLAGDKLLRNDAGRFVDVSEQAGIIGNPLGFGLSALVSDINQDGWLDLYVANDYIEDDYLYINNRDGTFTEALRAYLDHTSYSSMGADIADINNDALPDIITLDMLAEDNLRQKVLKGPEDHVFYEQMRRDGYYEQYMRNMLHVNNGTGDFSEIGQLAGVSNTDWSWAALLADFDNDGYKDLFVTNGYLRDYTNLDFLKTTLVEAYQEASARGEALSSLDMVEHMTTTPLKNYIYRNNADLTFANTTEAWGLGQPVLSNGAAYADLDNDGDLDLVVNNINQEAFIYRNEADRIADGNYLKLRLEGPAGNRWGIGARVELTGADGQRLYQEMIPGRGYLSAVEPVLLFGVGAWSGVELTVTWPDGAHQRLTGVATNQTLTLRHQDATDDAPTPPAPAVPHFVALEGQAGLAFTHRENPFSDFEREPLLPHTLSRQGPALAQGDLNQDGLADVFVGGAAGQPAALFLQQVDGTFMSVALEVFAAHQDYEDVDALFLDVDQDRDLDLYVVSGGYAEADGAPAYQDRVYRNEGFGRLVYAPDALPAITSSGSTVAAHDIDADGDLDLFVGGRVRAGQYPLAPRSYLLENTGGQFVDITAQAAPALLEPGLVTDALWHDLDGDDVAELVLVGEWMPLRVFTPGPDKTLREITAQAGFEGTNGWWNTIAAGDLDGDGDADLVAGNRGLNAQMQVDQRRPAAVHAADFDRNGTLDAVISAYVQDRAYPIVWRDELLEQMPGLAATFPTYASYARATLEDVLTAEQRRDALHLEAYVAETHLFENRGDGTFQAHALPVEAQVAPVNAVLIQDVNGDGLRDLLLAGNNYGVRAQYGRADAGRGLLLLGQGGLAFEPVPLWQSGVVAPGDVRTMVHVVTAAGPLVIVGTNNAALTAFTYRPTAIDTVHRPAIPVTP